MRQAVTASKDIVLSVLSHQHAPFESVLSALDIQPGGDSNPLFDVLFNYVNVGTEELQLGGLTLEPLPPGRVKSRYALSVSVAERADDFSVDIEYRTELFHLTRSLASPSNWIGCWWRWPPTRTDPSRC